MKNSFTPLEPVGGKPNTPHEILKPIEEDEDMTQEKFNEMMNNYRKALQDNDAGSWSQEDRDWCVEKGLVKGSSSGEPNYMWADFLTREQMAALLHRFATMIGKE